MSQCVGVVDYGSAGNTFSIVRALELAGAQPRVIKTPNELLNVDKLVLPGVGSFTDGMAELNASGMAGAVREWAAGGRPLLGICLGMQILCDVGFEYGETEGLGLVRGEVREMQCKGVVPHMGFNRVAVQGESPLLKGLGGDESLYFMHTFEVQNYTNIIALTEYAGHQFVSAVQRDNVFGVQFHPEKSREAGIRIFQNYLSL
ncbi:imidazole glycerol phosphate synthase subunit HisH [Aquipseudomonas alcaligenes]|uniref:imidazole glycerol phosphate synthase subunit HisH n=1 Tax=Aquipseudomonas alcaligenes TaxID=43263 RepID=UPI0035AE249D